MSDETETNTWQSSDGSTVVEWRRGDTRTRRYTSKPVLCSSLADWGPLWSTEDVKGFAHGQIIVAGNVIDNPAALPAHQRIGCEVELYGVIGAEETIIGRGVITQAVRQRAFRVDETDSYDAIGARCRYLVDGVFQNVTPIDATLHVVASLWR